VRVDPLKRLGANSFTAIAFDHERLYRLRLPRTRPIANAMTSTVEQSPHDGTDSASANDHEVHPESDTGELPMFP
jgi:hypothetical protein